MAFGETSAAERFAGSQREELPSWIREAYSIQGLAEAIKTDAKAAYYPAPLHPNLKAFQRVVRDSLLERNIDWRRDESNYPQEIVDVFTKHRESLKRNVTDPETLSAGLATLAAIFADVEEIQKEFSDYSLGFFEIRTRSKPEQQEPLGHQDHSVDPNTEVIVVVRTYFGLSTEYSDTEVGLTKIVPPPGAIVVHKAIDSSKDKDLEFPFHWIPEIGKEGRLTILCILSRKK